MWNRLPVFIESVCYFHCSTKTLFIAPHSLSSLGIKKSFCCMFILFIKILIRGYKMYLLYLLNHKNKRNLHKFLPDSISVFI